MKKKIEPNSNKLRCKKCNSTMTYIRLRTGELICRTCGNIEKLEVKKENG